MKPAEEDSSRPRQDEDKSRDPEAQTGVDAGLEDAADDESGEQHETVEAPSRLEGREEEPPVEQRRCGLRWIIANPVVIGLSIVGMVAGATVGIAGDPKASSFFIIVMLFAYTVLSINNLPYRLAPLAAMVTAHVASVLSYYSNPLPLPLVIVERYNDRYSINLDIVQIAIVYELYQIAASKPCKPENTKTPTEETSIPADTGPTPGEEPR